MRTYREYFIGGPMHGKDKMEVLPGGADWAPIYAMDHKVMDQDILKNAPFHVALDHAMDTDPDRWAYYRRTVHVTEMDTVYVWVDLRRTPQEVARLMMWELLMAPHIAPVHVNENEKGNGK